MTKEIWEILVPASNDRDLKFTHSHHKAWDAYVKNVTGGVTIMKTAKGEWVSPSGKTHTDRMIPCRIVCTEEQVSDIIDFTIAHYSQEAVLAYRISTNVILRHRDEMLEATKPKFLSTLITEGTIGSCPKCHSTEKREYWLGGKKIGCIQPQCDNYYKHYKNKL